MTEEEKKSYRDEMLQNCKNYAHIDYDDDADILAIMYDATIEELKELISEFDEYAMTQRQKILVFASVKQLYDQRDKYGDAQSLTTAVSSMLLKEIYK